MPPITGLIFVLIIYIHVAPTIFTQVIENVFWQIIRLLQVFISCLAISY